MSAYGVPHFMHKQPLMLKLTPMGNIESPINLHIFGLWEEVGAPEGNPRSNKENWQTPYRPAGSNPEETVLTTALVSL